MVWDTFRLSCPSSVVDQHLRRWANFSKSLLWKPQRIWGLIHPHICPGGPALCWLWLTQTYLGLCVLSFYQHCVYHTCNAIVLLQWTVNVVSDALTFSWGYRLSMILDSLLWTEILEADVGVAKSDGGDVGGTWLQLMCCALPKHLCP